MAGSKRKRGRAKASEDALAKIHRNWCEAHPARAAEERAIRQHVRAVEKNFGHVAYGTPETRAHVAKARQGALARLYATGAVTIHQLGAALEISAAYERIIQAAGIPTSWAIERVDTSMRSGQFETIGAVWAEVAYSRWRAALPQAGVVLAMIVEDCGLAAAARRFGMRKERAKVLLIGALDLWAGMHREARQAVNDDTLAEAHAAVA